MDISEESWIYLENILLKDWIYSKKVLYIQKILNILKRIWQYLKEIWMYPKNIGIPQKMIDRSKKCWIYPEMCIQKKRMYLKSTRYTQESL